MRTFRWLNISLLTILLTACGGEKIALENFDENAWKKDRFACGGDRGSLYENILAQKEKLLAHDEIDIVGLLGKPDENELYKRNEKFYYYYVEPAMRCGGATAGKRLVIRFNAVGLAKEILVE